MSAHSNIQTDKMKPSIQVASKSQYQWHSNDNIASTSDERLIAQVFLDFPNEPERTRFTGSPRLEKCQEILARPKFSMLRTRKRQVFCDH